MRAKIKELEQKVTTLQQEVQNASDRKKQVETDYERVKLNLEAEKHRNGRLMKFLNSTRAFVEECLL
jgi:hypothetical protein